mmetsp:Transcript_80718/g.250983  ORF Transcript_80718/g.250983 Transcript_80718/m.250983 type:complete len:220 (+) Transcript_80718:487-1146(+)
MCSGRSERLVFSLRRTSRRRRRPWQRRGVSSRRRWPRRRSARSRPSRTSRSALMKPLQSLQARSKLRAASKRLRCSRRRPGPRRRRWSSGDRRRKRLRSSQPRSRLCERRCPWMWRPCATSSRSRCTRRRPGHRKPRAPSSSAWRTPWQSLGRRSTACATSWRARLAGKRTARRHQKWLYARRSNHWRAQSGRRRGARRRLRGSWRASSRLSGLTRSRP